MREKERYHCGSFEKKLKENQMGREIISLIVLTCECIEALNLTVQCWNAIGNYSHL